MPTSAQRLETVRRIQTAMAAGYMTLGAWTLIHPASVLALGLTPPYLATCNATTTLFARCFGAQAMTCGLVLGTAEDLGERGFRAFALAMVPYVVAFNFWFSAWGPRRGMVTSLIWLDFVGNVGFLGGSWYCAKLLGEVRREREREGEGEGEGEGKKGEGKKGE